MRDAMSRRLVGEAAMITGFMFIPGNCMRVHYVLLITELPRVWHGALWIRAYA